MSGDLGRFDANGNLEIVGRKKDLIIRGGHNIHPAKIEDLAMRHHAVARCAAFAVADERLGEKVCLSVIFHEARRGERRRAARTPARAGLSRYDMPEYFIAMDRLPADRQWQDPEARTRRVGEVGPHPADAVRWTDPTHNNSG